MTLKAVFATAAVALLTALATPAGAVVFTMFYDDSLTGALDGTVIGTGTLSYDGPAAAGVFGIDSLTNFAFSVSFTAGDVFTEAGLGTPPGDVSIEVTDLGGGDFSVLFYGDGLSSPLGGSADFLNSALSILGHEPFPLILADAALGTVDTRAFQFLPASELESPIFGDYVGVTLAETVSEPAPVALFGLSLAGLVLGRRRLT